MAVEQAELARINIARKPFTRQENQLVDSLRELIGREAAAHHLQVVCVGTPLNTGDCLGPLTGSFLKRSLSPWREAELGTEIIGTLDEPVHARNLGLKLHTFGGRGAFVLAVDAAVGRVGEIVLVRRPLQPGAGLGRWLPQVGDAHLLCAVSPHPASFLSAHVGEVLNMAELLSRSLLRAILSAREGRLER